MYHPQIHPATATQGLPNFPVTTTAGYPDINDMLASPAFNSDSIIPATPEPLSRNGRIVCDTIEQYHQHKATSAGALKAMHKTPFHYRYYTGQRERTNEKEHFNIGLFAHLAFLQPEIFNSYIIEPAFPLTTRRGVIRLIRFYENANEAKYKPCDHLKMQELKTYLQQLKTDCKYPVIKKEYQHLVDILKYNYQHYGNGIIHRIMKGAVSAASFYATHPETGLPVKARADAFNITENIGVDAIISFRTTSADTIDKFISDAARYEYELNEGMCQEIVSQVTGRSFHVTIMIMLQTVPPFLPAVFWWDATDLANGKRKYHEGMQKVKSCLEASRFPGYDALAVNAAGIIHMKQPGLVHPAAI